MVPQISKWHSKLEKELEALKSKDLERQLKTASGRLNFSSNDYLSLNSSGQLQLIFQEELAKYSSPWIGSTASRLIRGHYEEFTALEADFAKRIAMPSALFFNSGYAANTGTLPAILSPRHDIVFCDRLCHASLLDGIRLSQTRRHYFRHNDLDDLESQIQKHNLKRKGNENFWIIVESVYSMEGDCLKIEALCDLAEKYDAYIYLDEAHAVGVFAKGGGLAHEKKLLDRIAVAVFPCGKALALMGAFVCGPKPLKALLVNKARSFIYSTAPPPFIAILLKRVLELVFSSAMDKKRAHLKALSQLLRTRLREMNFEIGTSDTQIIPLILGSKKRALELAEKCQKNGLDIRAIRPPTVADQKSRVRISLQAEHTKEDIEVLYNTLAKFI